MVGYKALVRGSFFSLVLFTDLVRMQLKFPFAAAINEAPVMDHFLTS